MTAVLKLVSPDRDHEVPEKHPDLLTRVQGKARELAVAKFRQIADQLEAGELDGASVSWLDYHGPESRLDVITRTPWTDSGVGAVRLVRTTIEEQL